MTKVELLRPGILRRYEKWFARFGWKEEGWPCASTKPQAEKREERRNTHQRSRRLARAGAQRADTSSPTRLASFSWRASGLTQALCQPPDASDLAEWASNLCPVVRFLGDDGSQPGRHRRLLRQWAGKLDGGFFTTGSVLEGVDVRVDEGAACTDQATTHIAFAALPDGRTCIGLQLVIAAADRVG